jgi:hypothetical protein
MRSPATGDTLLCGGCSCVCSDVSRCLGRAFEHMHMFVFLFVCKQAQLSLINLQIKHHLRLVDKTALGSKSQNVHINGLVAPHGAAG